MALKRLTTAEMVVISGPWTTNGDPARKAIQSVPTLAGLLPHLDAAHAALHAARPATDDRRVASISAEEATVDDRHDAVVRGVDLVLEGWSIIMLRLLLVSDVASYADKRERISKLSSLAEVAAEETEVLSPKALLRRIERRGERLFDAALPESRYQQIAAELREKAEPLS